MGKVLAKRAKTPTTSSADAPVQQTESNHGKQRKLLPQQSSSASIGQFSDHDIASTSHFADSRSDVTVTSVVSDSSSQSFLPQATPVSEPLTPLRSESDSSIGSHPRTPILKLTKRSKNEKPTAKTVAFVDATGSEVDNSVTERTRRIASKQLGAHKVFTIDDSVQMFFIDPDGSVQVQEDTTSLHLVRLARKAGRLPSDEYDTGQMQPSAFLHVGDWLYPLFPGCSPVMITAHGTYIFPDLRNNKQGYAIALVLPQYLPLDEREKFEILIDYYGSVEDSVNRLEANVDYQFHACDHRFDFIGDSLVSVMLSSESTPTMDPNAPTWLAFSENVEEPVLTRSRSAVLVIKSVFQLIIAIITYLTQLGVFVIQYVAANLRSRWRRTSTCHEVDPQILQGILYAKSATNKGVIVTNYVVDHLHEGTMNLSRLLAPRPSAFVPPPLKGTVVDIALRFTAEVSATAFGGVGDVYQSLNEAGTTLIDAFSEETIKTMEHSYGEEYANLTKEAFDAALNVREAMMNTTKITSLQFVPNTIRTRIDELKQPEDTDDNQRKREAKKRKGVLKLDPKDRDWATSLESQIHEERDSSKSWMWSSPSLEEQVTLDAKIRDSDHEISTKSWLLDHIPGALKPRPSASVSKTMTDHNIPEEQVQEVNAIGHFNPLSRLSSDATSSPSTDAKATPPPPKSAASFPSSSHKFRFPTRTDSNTSSLVSTASRGSSGLAVHASSSHHSNASGEFLIPSRRQSVYLTHRRQSMHVTAAMANVVQRRFSSPESSVVLAGCHRERDPNLFKEAAISITRAKIRRLHRERADERFLVVVKLSTTLLRSNDDSPDDSRRT